MLTFEASGILGTAAIVEKLQVNIFLDWILDYADFFRTCPSSRFSTAPTLSMPSPLARTVFSSW